MKNIFRLVMNYYEKKKMVPVITTLIVWVVLFYLLFKRSLIVFYPVREIFVKEGKYFVEPLFHSLVWLKVWGHNSIIFILVFICMIAISLPLGYLLISRAFNNFFVNEERIFIALPIGFLANIVIWTFLILWIGRFNVFLYVGATGLVTCMLYLIKRNSELVEQGKVEFSFIRILLPLIVIIYSLATFNNIFKDAIVPFSWDAMSTSYFEFIMKGEKAYPLVHPYTGSATSVYINYPPAFDITVVLFSSILTFVPLLTMQMGVVMCCFVLVPLALFYIVKDITQSNIFALFASFLTVGRGFIYSTWQSDFPEALSILSAAVFILILNKTFITNDKVNSKIQYVQLIVGGMFFSISMLSNTKIFQIYFISYLLFIIISYLTSKSKKTIFYILIFTLLGLSVVSLPWVFYMIKNSVMQQIAQKMPFWWPVLNLRNFLLCSNSYQYLYFSMIGFCCSLFYLKKDRIILFFLIYCIVAILMIKHHLLLEIFSPEWFSYRSIPHSTIFPYIGGTDKLFSSKFLIYVHEIGHYGFTIVAPVLIVISTSFIYKLFKKLLCSQINKVCLTIILLSTVIIENNRIPGGAGTLLSYQDYEVLRQLSKITKYGDTLILNPWHMSYTAGNWTAPVSGRKTVFFRYDSYFIKWKEKSLDTEKLKWVYKNIDDPESMEILKKYGITHIFLPSGSPVDLKEKYDKMFKDKLESISGDSRSVIYNTGVRKSGLSNDETSYPEL